MGRLRKISLIFLLIGSLGVAPVRAEWPSGDGGKPLAWGRMVLVTSAVVGGVYFLTRLIKVEPVYRLAGPATGAVDFGPVDVGTVRILPVRFLNSGGRAVRFYAEVMGTQFALTQPAQGSVAPGRELVLSVEYRPTQPGPTSAFLSVIVVDQREALRVELLGQGTAIADATTADNAAGAGNH